MSCSIVSKLQIIKVLTSSFSYLQLMGAQPLYKIHLLCSQGRWLIRIDALRLLEPLAMLLLKTLIRKERTTATYVCLIRLLIVFSARRTHSRTLWPLLKKRPITASETCLSYIIQTQRSPMFRNIPCLQKEDRLVCVKAAP